MNYQEGLDAALDAFQSGDSGPLLEVIAARSEFAENMVRGGEQSPTVHDAFADIRMASMLLRIRSAVMKYGVHQTDDGGLIWAAGLAEFAWNAIQRLPESEKQAEVRAKYRARVTQEVACCMEIMLIAPMWYTGNPKGEYGKFYSTIEDHRQLTEMKRGVFVQPRRERPDDDGGDGLPDIQPKPKAGAPA